MYAVSTAVILLNKVDLVTPEHLGQLEAAIRRMNPRARIIHCTGSKVPVRAAFNIIKKRSIAFNVISKPDFQATH